MQMKSIMENWNSFQAETNFDTLYKGTENQVSFSLICEGYKTNQISESELTQLWNEAIDFELGQLVNEGIIDTIKNGMSSAYAKALEIFNEFVTKQFFRITGLLQNIISVGAKAVRPVISVLNKLVSIAKQLRSTHQMLCNTILGITVAFTTTLAMGIFASEAEAAIKIGKHTFEGHDNNSLAAIKGLCEVVGEVSPEQEIKLSANNCISLVNHFADSKEVLDVTDHIDGAEGLIKRVWSMLSSMSSVAKETDDDTLREVVSDLIAHGHEQTLKITRTITKWKVDQPGASGHGYRETTKSVGDAVSMATSEKVTHTGIASDLAGLASKVGK